MSLLKILEGTTFEQLVALREKRKTDGFAFLHGVGDRQRGIRSDISAAVRGASDSVAIGNGRSCLKNEVAQTV